MFTATLIISIFAAPPTSPGEVAEQRPFHEIRGDMRTYMTQESQAKTELARAKAVRGLCVLYKEVARDPRLLESDTLESYKVIMWGRLTRVKKKLEQIESIKARREGRKPPSDNEIAARKAADSMASTVAAQVELTAYSLGGPARLFADAGSGGGAAVADYGTALIDLIERTIEPDFWDVNGGPGSMFYYQPLHALVVRATAEVHRELGGAIGGLRAAGR